MHRLHVQLPDEVYSLLQRQAEETGASHSEIVRRAIQSARPAQASDELLHLILEILTAHEPSYAESVTQACVILRRLAGVSIKSLPLDLHREGIIFAAQVLQRLVREAEQDIHRDYRRIAP